MKLEEAPVIPQIDYRLTLSYEELCRLENIANIAVAHPDLCYADQLFARDLRSKIVDKIPF